MGLPFAWSTVTPPPHLSTTGGLILRRAEGREALVAIRPFRAGEIIFTFDHATWRCSRDVVTVDDAAGRPVYDPLLARVARVAPRDGPNCRADFDLMALIAGRRIDAGETLTLARSAPASRKAA